MKGYSHFLNLGDFNFPDINWTTYSSDKNINHISRRLTDGIKYLYLHQHVSRPTRYRVNQRPNTLDFVFTNKENMKDKEVVEKIK